MTSPDDKVREEHLEFLLVFYRLDDAPELRELLDLFDPIEGEVCTHVGSWHR